MISIKEKETTTKIHGTTLVDNFQWMKTDKSEAVELIKTINKETKGFLNGKKNYKRHCLMSLRIELLKIMIPL